MSSHKRIALNTFASYFQSIIAIGLGLFTGRWVLNALGEVNFGLFAIVGSLTGFISIINVSMTTSISRHLAYAIGQSTKNTNISGEIFTTKEWFNTAICINFILPAFFAALVFPIGEWYITTHLNADASLIPACKWVFRFSLISTFFAVLSSPYLAMYTAKQYIFVRNSFSVIQTVFLALEGYILFSIPDNRLFFHAALVTFIYILTNCMLVVVAAVQFKECRIKFSDWVHLKRIKELTSFCGFTMLATFGYMMRGTGTAILVNHFAGARANAGIGIGNQVATKTSFLSSSLANAITPEITTRLGSGKSGDAIKFAVRYSFYNLVARSFFVFPIIVYIHEILNLWLKHPPLWAAEFCVIFMASTYLFAFASGQGLLVTANGKIAIFELFQFLSAVSGVLVVFILYLLGVETVFAVGAGMLSAYSLQTATSVYFAKKLLSASLRSWLALVVIPGILLSGLSLSASFGCKQFLPAQFFSFLITLPINAVCVLTYTYFSLDSREKEFFKSIRVKLFKKMFAKK